MKRAVIRGRFVRPLMSTKPEKGKKESLGLNRLREARLSVGELGGCVAAEDTFRFQVQGTREGRKKNGTGTLFAQEAAGEQSRTRGPSRLNPPKGSPPYDGQGEQEGDKERTKERRARDYLDLDGPALRRMSRSTAGGGREEDVAAGAEAGWGITNQKKKWKELGIGGGDGRGRGGFIRPFLLTSNCLNFNWHLLGIRWIWPGKQRKSPGPLFAFPRLHLTQLAHLFFSLQFPQLTQRWSPASGLGRS
jgi:hypothetical protein